MFWFKLFTIFFDIFTVIYSENPECFYILHSYFYSFLLLFGHSLYFLTIYFWGFIYYEPKKKTNNHLYKYWRDIIKLTWELQIVSLFFNVSAYWNRNSNPSDYFDQDLQFYSKIFTGWDAAVPSTDENVN